MTGPPDPLDGPRIGPAWLISLAAVAAHQAFEERARELGLPPAAALEMAKQTLSRALIFEHVARGGDRLALDGLFNKTAGDVYGLVVVGEQRLREDREKALAEALAKAGDEATPGP